MRCLRCHAVRREGCGGVLCRYFETQKRVDTKSWEGDMMITDRFRLNFIAALTGLLVFFLSDFRGRLECSACKRQTSVRRDQASH